MKKCYLCGEELINKRNKSKDHVPPYCIFPQEKPRNLITIPCCKNCNNEFAQLDEKMRDFLAILALDKSGDVGKNAKRNVLKTQKRRDEFLAYTKKNPTLLDDNGNPRLEFFFNRDELNAWLIRVVKGLFFRRYKTRISDNAIYKVDPIPQFVPQPSDTFPMEKGLEFRPYFVYGVIQEPNNDFWVLYFYDKLTFSVSVNNPI